MRIFCESSFFGWTMNLLPVLYADVIFWHKNEVHTFLLHMTCIDHRE